MKFKRFREKLCKLKVDYKYVDEEEEMVKLEMEIFKDLKKVIE